MSEPELSFKDMCAQYDVTPRTLRYYEYIELLAPRRDGRARFYSQRDQARMTLILRGRRWGFSLEEIRQWLEIYENDGTQAQMQLFTGLASDKLNELRAQRSQLDQAIDELSDLHADLIKQYPPE